MLQPIVVVRQEAVGQGGFHHGVMGLLKPDIRWIFDCGAMFKDGKDNLRTSVDDMLQRSAADRRKFLIDLLFISHFDLDHVEGLDHLLLRSRSLERWSDKIVDVAIIPYIEPKDFFRRLAGARPDDLRYRSLVDLVTDPEKWCADRRIRRLIRLRPFPPEDDGDATPEQPYPKPPDLKTPISIDDSDRGGALALSVMRSDGTALKWGSSQHHIEIAVEDTGLAIRVAKRDALVANWCFLPFAHDWHWRAGRLAEAAVTRKLKDIVGLDPTSTNSAEFSTALIEALANPSRRSRLKTLYKQVDDNSNGISLSLYCGVLPDCDFRSGWLLTGDAPLKDTDRFKQWRSFYESIFRCTQYLMLPHHGAGGRYFNERLLDIGALDDAALFLTAKEGDERRPHPEVAGWLREYGKRRAARSCHRVGHKSASAICELAINGTLANEADRERANAW